MAHSAAKLFDITTKSVDFKIQIVTILAYAVAARIKFNKNNIIAAWKMFAGIYGLLVRIIPHK